MTLKSRGPIASYYETFLARYSNCRILYCEVAEFKGPFLETGNRQPLSPKDEWLRSTAEKHHNSRTCIDAEPRFRVSGLGSRV